MPKKKNMNDYLVEFYNDHLHDKYGTGEITPQIYKKELLSFIKTMDPEFALKNVVEFINLSANDVTNVPDSNENFLTNDRNLMPYKYFDGILEKNIPSKEVYEAIDSNMSKQAFINYCEYLKGDVGIESKNSAIAFKLNKFKMIEAIKPRGNKVSTFFKKLFNIGGYNDKLAAYESCKQTLKEFIGDRLSNEEFEREIQNNNAYSSVKQSDEVIVDLSKEFVEKQEEEKVIDTGMPEKETTNDLVK